MRKLLTVLAVILLTACSNHDANYYATHPKALQQVLKHCPQHAPQGLSCDELKSIALHVNELAYELRSDQLAYGQRILALQQKQAEKMMLLEKHPEDQQIKHKLEALNHVLDERLFVVKWLESPRRSV